MFIFAYQCLHENIYKNTHATDSYSFYRKARQQKKKKDYIL